MNIEQNRAAGRVACAAAGLVCDEVHPQRPAADAALTVAEVAELAAVLAAADADARQQGRVITRVQRAALIRAARQIAGRPRAPAPRPSLDSHYAAMASMPGLGIISRG